MPAKVLVVDDEEQLCISLSRLLEAKQFSALYTTDPTKALDIIRGESIDLLISDLKMPGISGTDLMKSIRSFNKQLPIIMVSGYANVDNVVRAMKYGASNFFEKPVRFKDLLQEISRLIPRERESTATSPRVLNYSHNPKMQEKIDMLKKAAPTDAHILVSGESGTGKEIAAETIFQSSTRSDKAFIKINCAAIPENLIESELFGYEKGAFTGASQARAGKFEIADGGTIFLDEIAELDIKVQAKLLRILQEKELQRLGSHKVKKVDVRIIAATNRDLEQQIREGLFREDLFYRLSVINIHLPPLRERKEDILPLSEIFLASFCERYKKRIHCLDSAVKQLFIGHSWPGNIRELKNCIERMVIFCERDQLGRELVPEQYRRFESEAIGQPLQRVSDSVKREIILDALEKCRGSRSRASEMLGISRRTLYNKMKKLNIEA